MGEAADAPAASPVAIPDADQGQRVRAKPTLQHPGTQPPTALPGPSRAPTTSPRSRGHVCHCTLSLPQPPALTGCCGASLVPQGQALPLGRGHPRRPPAYAGSRSEAPSCRQWGWARAATLPCASTAVTLGKAFSPHVILQIINSLAVPVPLQQQLLQRDPVVGHGCGVAYGGHGSLCGPALLACPPWEGMAWDKHQNSGMQVAVVSLRGSVWYLRYRKLLAGRDVPPPSHPTEISAPVFLGNARRDQLHTLTNQLLLFPGFLQTWHKGGFIPPPSPRENAPPRTARGRQRCHQPWSEQWAR